MLRLPDRALLVAGALLVAAPVGVHWIYVRFGLDPRAAVMAVVDRSVDAGSGTGGSWTNAVMHNLMNPLRRLANLLGENRMFKVIGVFALGLWAGRRRIYLDPAAHRTWLTVLLILGAALGLPACWYFEVLSADEYFPATQTGVTQSVAYAVGVVPLGIAWASGFALLWLRPAWQKRLAVFAPAGRMALSNYLAQSVICAPIFLLAASGLTGTLGPLLWPPVAAVILALQIGWSRRWLSRHRHGPLEGVRRRLTYRSAHA